MLSPQKVVVFANLKQRKLAGHISQGMLLAATNSDMTKLLRANEDSEVGSRIGLSNYGDLEIDENNFQEFLPNLNPKKKS